MSLHYVFWHWPRAGVDQGVYTGKLRRFHEELSTHIGSAGLQGAPAAFRSPAPTWLPPDATVAFSDWYAMENSSQLDALNAGAVSDEVKVAHAELAALYGGGAGSLYDYKRGAAFDPAFVHHSHWFPKPSGMTYDDFYALLAPVTAQPKAALLRRRMVLGPSPEFCLASEQPIELPTPITGILRLPMSRLG